MSRWQPRLRWEWYVELDKLGTAMGLWIDSSCEAWRLQLDAASVPRSFTRTITPPAEGGATLAVEAHFVPR